MKLTQCLLAALPLALMAAGAHAQTADPLPINSGDTAWMLTSVALVLMMTIPGLALFYGGMVRKQNVLSTKMQAFVTCALVAVLWVVVGYSLAFTGGNAWVGDLSRVFISGVDFANAFVLQGGDSTPVPTTIPEPVFMMFQMTFAIITPVLIAGAFADRMKFSATLLFMGLWSILVYPVIAHWVWHPNGFLFKAGVLDFAGGTVVHINAGIAGLVAAIVIGKRRGYGQQEFLPHNQVLTFIGACLLWVGWFGFNGGSALAANGRAGLAIAVTMIGAAAAALAWMFTEWGVRGKPSVIGALNGAVTGLVVITPAAGFVNLQGALAMGVIGGMMCFFSATKLKEAFGYDDSLDCFGIHGVGGIIGALLTGVFALSTIGGDAAKGAIEGNFHQIWLQAQGVFYTIVWCAVATYVILKVVDAIVGLRVSEQVENKGLDLELHGEFLPH
ncbi:MAG: ammonium transporter [Holosporales bacterium]|jgi:Amt family ammonium transporter